MSDSQELSLNDQPIRIDRRRRLHCPVDGCAFECIDERAMAGHLRTQHDGAGRWGPRLLADGAGESDPEQFREHLLQAAEARDDERLRAAEEALLQALSDVRRDLQLRVAEREEVEG